MISQTEAYALRAMTCLAFRFPDYMTRNQLSEAADVPHAYLPKIMLELNRTGLIRSQRGQNGGYALIPTPQEISLLDVIKSIKAGSQRELYQWNSDTSNEIRQLDQHLNHTFSMLETSLEQTSLADIFNNSNRPTTEVTDRVQ
ncbi:RrF2 family transcriptional regulator [Gimesia algae]|nr:Rrf2 family transcriptional regulator [Gimesia algae]